MGLDLFRGLFGWRYTGLRQEGIESRQELSLPALEFFVLGDLVELVVD